MEAIKKQWEMTPGKFRQLQKKVGNEAAGCGVTWAQGGLHPIQQRVHAVGLSPLALEGECEREGMLQMGFSLSCVLS